jgi:hypothetical protein
MTQEPDKAQLELQKLSLEVQRLSYEVREKGRTGFSGGVAKFSPLLATLLALSGFLFGVFQYTRQQVATRQAAIETRDQEFMRPLWQQQLTLYFKASELVATIATTPDAATRRAAEADFWKLYEGPLIVVESQNLSGAMKAFGTCLTANPRCDEAELRRLSRELSSVIQQDIQGATALRLSEFSKNKFQYGR